MPKNIKDTSTKVSVYELVDEHEIRAEFERATRKCDATNTHTHSRDLCRSEMTAKSLSEESMVFYAIKGLYREMTRHLFGELGMTYNALHEFSYERLSKLFQSLVSEMDTISWSPGARRIIHKASCCRTIKIDWKKPNIKSNKIRCVACSSAETTEHFALDFAGPMDEPFALHQHKSSSDPACIISDTVRRCDSFVTKYDNMFEDESNYMDHHDMGRMHVGPNCIHKIVSIFTAKRHLDTVAYNVYRYLTSQPTLPNDKQLTKHLAADVKSTIEMIKETRDALVCRFSLKHSPRAIDIDKSFWKQLDKGRRHRHKSCDKDTFAKKLHDDCLQAISKYSTTYLDDVMSDAEDDTCSEENGCESDSKVEETRPADYRGQQPGRTNKHKHVQPSRKRLKRCISDSSDEDTPDTPIELNHSTFHAPPPSPLHGVSTVRPRSINDSPVQDIPSFRATLPMSILINVLNYMMHEQTHQDSPSELLHTIQLYLNCCCEFLLNQRSKESMHELTKKLIHSTSRALTQSGNEDAQAIQHMEPFIMSIFLYIMSTGQRNAYEHEDMIPILQSQDNSITSKTVSSHQEYVMAAAAVALNATLMDGGSEANQKYKCATLKLFHLCSSSTSESLPSSSTAPITPPTLMSQVNIAASVRELCDVFSSGTISISEKTSRRVLLSAMCSYLMTI
jgi:hypothetical protein